MTEDTTGIAGTAAVGVRTPGLSFPLTAFSTALEAGPSGPVFSVHAEETAMKTADVAEVAENAGVAALAAEDPARSLPGMDAWSLACRRKTLRGLWRGWLLKSHKPVR